MTMPMTQTSTPSRPALHSTGAIFAGLVTVAVLSTATDAVLHALAYYPTDGSTGGDPQLAVALAYRTLFTALGGALTAWLAPSRPLRHSVILGAIGTALAILGVVSMWSVGHNWYPIGLVLLAIPSTALGGVLFIRARR